MFHMQAERNQGQIVSLALDPLCVIDMGGSKLPKLRRISQSHFSLVITSI
jgi:hypothetical protein